jgi:hypothetical protein
MAPHGEHAGTPSPLLTKEVLVAVSSVPNTEDEKTLLLSGPKVVVPAPPTPVCPPEPLVDVAAVVSRTTLPPHAAIEAAVIQLIQNQGRIGRSLHLGRGIAAVGVKTPVQTVRADFPHTAYR